MFLGLLSIQHSPDQNLLRGTLMGFFFLAQPLTKPRAGRCLQVSRLGDCNSRLCNSFMRSVPFIELLWPWVAETQILLRGVVLSKLENTTDKLVNKVGRKDIMGN